MIAELRFDVIRHNIRAIGMGTANTVRNPFRCRMPFPIEQIMLARKRIIPSFAISAGCTEIPAIFSHLFAPWDSVPNGMINKIRTTETIYPSIAKRSQK